MQDNILDFSNTYLSKESYIFDNDELAELCSLDMLRKIVDTVSQIPFPTMSRNNMSHLLDRIQRVISHWRPLKREVSWTITHSTKEMECRET